MRWNHLVSLSPVTGCQIAASVLSSLGPRRGKRAPRHFAFLPSSRRFARFLLLVSNQATGSPSCLTGELLYSAAASELSALGHQARRSRKRTKGAIEGNGRSEQLGGAIRLYIQQSLGAGSYPEPAGCRSAARRFAFFASNHRLSLYMSGRADLPYHLCRSTANIPHHRCARYSSQSTTYGAGS